MSDCLVLLHKMNGSYSDRHFVGELEKRHVLVSKLNYEVYSPGIVVRSRQKQENFFPRSPDPVHSPTPLPIQLILFKYCISNQKTLYKFSCKLMCCWLCRWSWCQSIDHTSVYPIKCPASFQSPGVCCVDWTKHELQLNDLDGTVYRYLLSVIVMCQVITHL
jgi:hypothetical protein